MIAMSDSVILLVSASVLATGIYRWQNNIEMANVHSVPTNQIALNQVSAGQDSTSAELMTGNRTAVMNAQGGLMGKPVGSQTNTQSSVNQVLDPSTQLNVQVKPDTAETANTGASAASLYGLHIVESGDTLSALSNRYGTTVEALQAINAISGSLINVGQELHYPLPAN